MKRQWIRDIALRTCRLLRVVNSYRTSIYGALINRGPAAGTQQLCVP
jgi:hypothetical protein